MDEIKLKPCPFCGGEAMLTTNLYAGIVYIQCKCCTAMVGRKRKIVSSMIGKEYFVNKEEAIEAWNRRAEHEQSGAYQHSPEVGGKDRQR